MRHRIGLTACLVTTATALLLTACAAGSSGAGPARTDGQAALWVEIAPKGLELQSRSPRIALRRTDGGDDTVIDRWIQRDGDGIFAPLSPGPWLLSAKLPLACPGHAAYVHTPVHLTKGATEVVRLALPRGDARLELDVEEDTPPFVLLLLDPAAMTPRTLRSLGAYYELPANPDVRFEVMSDGRSWLDLPRLPAGKYVALVCANDWEEGNPPIVPRTIPVTLEAGMTSVLHLSDKLTVLRFEH